MRTMRDVATPQLDLVTIRMARTAYEALLRDLTSRPAEVGGLLLGPLGTNDVTAFVFDHGGVSNHASYTPDVRTLNRRLREEFIPAGIDFKGATHSHPRGFDRLSPGDLAYIERLLARNPDMPLFIAPIVLPERFQVLPFAVRRETPRIPQLARVEFF